MTKNMGPCGKHSFETSDVAYSTLNRLGLRYPGTKYPVHAQEIARLQAFQCSRCLKWHLWLTPERHTFRTQFRFKRAEMDKACVGVTFGWDGSPEHLWRWDDGVKTRITEYRALNPEHFDADGWPVDPVTFERLGMYVPEFVKVELDRWQERFIQWLGRWMQRFWKRIDAL